MKLRRVFFLKGTVKNLSESEEKQLIKRTEAAIRATEKALKKHLSLVKKRERIPSIVATVERLRWDIREKDIEKIEEHLKKLNDLTKGFSGRVLQKKIK